MQKNECDGYLRAGKMQIQINHDVRTCTLGLEEHARLERYVNQNEAGFVGMVLGVPCVVMLRLFEACFI